MSSLAPGIKPARLTEEVYETNFADLFPAYSDHEALVAADRCYFCFDAPCVTACPTEIDIPMFIRQISAGQPENAARTIFEQNILGGMCARVCPTEELCEEACVRQIAEGAPVTIGRLQRYATDRLMEEHPYERAPETGKRVAVVGAGPAGLAAAHRLAMLGHAVTLYDARRKLGGLNEFGIATYKVPGDFAQSEVNWLLGIGGIAVEHGVALGQDITLGELAEGFDAVFLGLGLAGVNALGIEGAEIDGVDDAVGFIAMLRQAELSDMPVGRRVVVIGGGMTAVDAAVQAKLLGAEEVSMVYRRGKAEMNASDWEQDLAASKGVRIKYGAQPVRFLGSGALEAVEFEYTRYHSGKLMGTGETFEIPADQALVAIGQAFDGAPVDTIALEKGRVVTDEAGRTSHAKVWAGGDCTNRGDDLTVTAVAQGRDAAMSIHEALS